MNRFLFFFFCIIIFFSCSQNSVPKNMVQPDKMKIILWQMTVAEQVEEADTSLSVRTHLRDSITYIYQRILKDNNVSFDTYKNSLKYYMSSPELMQALLDSANSYGNKMTTALQKTYKPKSETITPALTPHPVPASKNPPPPAIHRLPNANNKFNEIQKAKALPQVE